MNANGAREATPDVESAEDGRHRLADLLAVQDAIIRLLSAVSPPPTRVLVRVGEVECRLQWQATTAPAPAGPSTAGPSYPGQAALADRPPADDAGIDFFHAPTVGVFYLAAEPGGPPFVEPGVLVVPGQQVGIIEAMKLMIPLEADRHCRILRVLAANGAPVEFGERLFSVAPVEPA